MADADLPIIAELGNALGAGFRRFEQKRPARRERAFRGYRPLLLAAALFVVIGGSAAAGTLLVLRGSVIPGPSEQDVGPQMTPVPATAQLANVHAQDPAGGPPWTIRIARSKTGLVCTAAGQLVGGRFGIVGLDRTFRTLAPTFADSCGQERPDHAALIGARVFDARTAADVRTVVNGVGGPRLRRATLTVAGVSRPLRVGGDGAFVAVIRGYPEDLGVGVKLTFADGHTETHSFGRSPFITRDPAGGRAWRTEGFVTDGSDVLCVRFESARAVNPIVSGPSACGLARGSRFFFELRLVRPGEHGRLGIDYWNWRWHPARTVLWGAAGGRVTRILVSGPGGTQRVPIPVSRAFLAMFPGSVPPGSLIVTVHFSDGRVQRYRGSTNLLPFPRSR